MARSQIKNIILYTGKHKKRPFVDRNVFPCFISRAICLRTCEFIGDVFKDFVFTMAQN